MSKKLLIYEIEKVGPPITINTMTEIQLIGEKMIEENMIELKKAEKDIQTILDTLCKEEKEEMRPPECPQKYWKYIFDDQKDKIGERFDGLRIQKAYDTDIMIENHPEDAAPLDISKLPKNRLEEIMEKLLLIDISTETPHWKKPELGLTLKRAQITPNWVNFTQKEQNVPKRLKKTENPQEQKPTL